MPRFPLPPRVDERDWTEWPYAHWLYRGDELLAETVHTTEASLMVEVQASHARIRRGEATHLAVDGVPDATVARWRETA